MARARRSQFDGPELDRYRDATANAVSAAYADRELLKREVRDEPIPIDPKLIAVYEDRDGTKIAIRERQFQAYALKAMGWSLREIAFHFNIGYEIIRRDIITEGERRHKELTERHMTIVMELATTLDEVIKQNFLWLTNASSAPRGVNPSTNIIKAVALKSAMLGITKPGTTGEEPGGPNGMANIFGVPGEEMTVMILRTAIEMRNAEKNVTIEH